MQRPRPLHSCRLPGADIVDPWQKYEKLEERGKGSFGVIYKVREKETGEILAVKLLKRGRNIDDNVKREIINHRNLRPHPNVIGFKEVR